MDRTRALISAVVTAAVLAGCTGVTGTPVPAPDLVRVATPLADLLLAPSAFPPQFPAVVLAPAVVGQAAADLTGIADGARADPPGCKPQAADHGPDGTAIAVGTTDDARATLTVELARTDLPLAALRGQLQRCPQVSALNFGVVSTVRSEILPAPAVDADDTLAVRRAVDSADHLGSQHRTLHTLLAQHGDVRVSVTLMSFGDAANETEADAAALADLFATAVERVRAG